MFVIQMIIYRPITVYIHTKMNLQLKLDKPQKTNQQIIGYTNHKTINNYKVSNHGKMLIVFLIIGVHHILGFFLLIDATVTHPLGKSPDEQ